jgi:cytochrome P450
MRRDRLRFVRSMTERYGDVSRLSIGGRRLILVSSKSGVQQVLQHQAARYTKGMGLSEGRQFFGDGLVTSEADAWRLQRTTLTPFFQSSGFRVWSDPIKDAIARCIGELGDTDAAAHGVDLARFAGDLSCTILSRTIIGAPLDAVPLRRALTIVDDYVNAKMTGILPEPPLQYLRYKLAMRYIERVTASVIEHNRRAQDAASLVSYMLASKAADRLAIRDQTASFLLAGQDNTTSTISWALLLLAANPHVQAALRANLAGRVLDAEISPDVMERQRFACAVIFEALRLFPPVWAIPRHAVADTDIDGFHVPAGSDVLLFPFLVHRDPRDWPDPHRFDPTRFLHDDGSRMLSVLSGLRNGRVFIPFGYGPRSCIGFQHALVVSTTVVAALVESFEISLPRGADVPAAMPGLSLRPRRGTSLRFTRVRKTAAGMRDEEPVLHSQFC